MSQNPYTEDSALEAIKADKTNFLKIPRSFRHDKKFVTKAYKINPEIKDMIRNFTIEELIEEDNVSECDVLPGVEFESKEAVKVSCDAFKYINKNFLDKKEEFNVVNIAPYFSGNVSDINKKDKNGNTMLIWASRNGYTEIVKLLLSHEKIDVNIQGEYNYTALTIASWEGYTEIVKLLLKNENINVNLQDMFKNTALIWASRKGHTDIVDLLY